MGALEGVGEEKLHGMQWFRDSFGLFCCPGNLFEAVATFPPFLLAFPTARMDLALGTMAGAGLEQCQGDIPAFPRGSSGAWVVFQIFGLQDSKSEAPDSSRLGLLKEH